MSTSVFLCCFSSASLLRQYKTHTIIPDCMYKVIHTSKTQMSIILLHHVRNGIYWLKWWSVKCSYVSTSVFLCCSSSASLLRQYKTHTIIQDCMYKVIHTSKTQMSIFLLHHCTQWHLLVKMMIRKMLLRVNVSFLAFFTWLLFCISVKTIQKAYHNPRLHV